MTRSLAGLEEEEKKDLATFIRSDLRNIEEYTYRTFSELQRFFPGIKIEEDTLLDSILNGYPYGYGTFNVLNELADKEKKTKQMSQKGLYKIISETVSDAINKSEYKVEGYDVKKIKEHKSLEDCYRHYRNEYMEGIGLKKYIEYGEKKYIENREKFLRK